MILQGDLRQFLKRKEALKPATAVRFALDIARSVFICYFIIVIVVVIIIILFFFQNWVFISRHVALGCQID